MANEISITVSLSVEKSNLEMEKSISTLATMSGNAYHHSVQVIGETNEALTVSGDVGTYGYTLLRNLSSTDDSTDYIHVGTTNDTTYTIRLYYGDVALFRAAASTLYAKVIDVAEAGAITMDLEYWVIEA